MSGRHSLTTSIPYVNAAPPGARPGVRAGGRLRPLPPAPGSGHPAAERDGRQQPEERPRRRAGRDAGAELVDGYATVFRGLEDALGVQYDDFIRTSADARHLVGVRRLWETIDRRGGHLQAPLRGAVLRRPRAVLHPGRAGAGALS